MSMGGVPRVINIWANYFVNKDLDIELVSNIKVPLFYDFDSRIKYSILGIDQFNQSSRILALLRIYSFIRGRSDEVLVFNKALYINYLFLLRRLKLIKKDLKLVYFVHGGSSNFFTMYNSLTNCKINYVFDKIIALHDDHNDFVAQSQGLNDEVDSLKASKGCWLGIKQKISYIPNPVSFRSDVASLCDNKVVLAAGRLDYLKGFDLLIRSWENIAKIYPEWRLKIVGDGPERENLEELVAKLSLENSVSLLPRQKDIKSQYLSSSIYVMPSRREGFGMVTIEAMECGLPIVAFRNVGSKFLVKDNINGLLCDIGDNDKLSANIMKLINNVNLRVDMGRKSRELSKEFYVENIADKWHSVLGFDYE